MQMVLKEKLLVLKKRIFRTIRGEGKRRKSGTGRKRPYMESLSGKLQMWKSWKWLMNDYFF